MAINQAFDIVGSYNKSDATEFDPQRLVNLYVDDDPKGKNGKALFTTPGLSLEEGVDFGGERVGRRLYLFDNDIYAVVGDSIYSVSSDLHFTFIGTIGTESGYVGIADNGKEVMFVDGTGGWIWNKSASSFTQISAPGFPTQPSDVTILGSRFIVNNIGSNKLHFSEIEDGTSWNALDEFAITQQPDEVVGLRRLNDRLFIMGKRITEVWYDAGGAVLPYRRSDVLPIGCAAVGSIAEGFGNLLWISRTDQGMGSVVITTGTQEQSISTQNVETELQRYPTVEDGRAFVYRNERGHIFYQISFTEADKSWAYDVSEKRWSELDYDSAIRHRAQDHVFFNTAHYVIDYNLPRLYEFSTKHFTDDGVNIRRRRISPILFEPKNRRFIINSILFDLKQGVGAELGDDANPKIRMRVSIDGGITYGKELSTPMGRYGQRRLRSPFFRLGQADSFIFDITYDNSTQFVVLGATVNIDVEQGGF